MPNPFRDQLAWAGGLSLLEVLRFGPCWWWWRLRWAVIQEYRGFDIQEVVSRHTAGGAQELSYGETPTVTLARLFELADLEPRARFVDLGSGRGLTVLAAALMGYEACGLELLEEYVKRARNVARRLKIQAEFRHSDILEEPWPEAELYLLNSTAFPQGFRDRLTPRLASLQRASIIVTYDWELSDEFFQEISSLRLPVTLGTVLCRLYQTNTNNQA